MRYVLYSAAAATAAAAVVSWTLIQGSPAAAAKPNVVNGTPSTPDRIQATVPEVFAGIARISAANETSSLSSL